MRLPIQKFLTVYPEKGNCLKLNIDFKLIFKSITEDCLFTKAFHSGIAH